MFVEFSVNNSSITIVSGAYMLKVIKTKTIV